MMTRLILTICMMIGLMMPCAWAEEKTVSSALSQVTITAEDWVEGNKYHIRYTFTNPTDEMIDEEIILTDVTYDLCEGIPFNKDITQCSEMLSRLTIAPHASYTTTISLQQPVPTKFNYLRSGTFYFADGSYLRYAPPDTLPKSHFALLPSVSPSGDISLTIQNNSSDETITELRNIQLYFVIDGQTCFAQRAEPTPIEIKPSRKLTIPLGTFECPFDKKYSSRVFYAYMQLNGVLHCYTESFFPHVSSQPTPNGTICRPFKAEYHPSDIIPSSQDGIYTLDDTFLHIYFPIENRTAFEKSVPYAIHFRLKYFDYASCYHNKPIVIYPPQDLHMAPKEIKYFYSKIPLPPDFCKLIPNFTPCISTARDLSEPTLFPSSKRSLSIPKEQYIPLDNIKIIGL